MNRQLSILSVLTSSLLGTVGWAEDLQNPVLAGFHADPSICRVGDDYYLVCSLFETADNKTASATADFD